MIGNTRMSAQPDDFPVVTVCINPDQFHLGLLSSDKNNQSAEHATRRQHFQLILAQCTEHWSMLSAETVSETVQTSLFCNAQVEFCNAFVSCFQPSHVPGVLMLGLDIAYLWTKFDDSCLISRSTTPLSLMVCHPWASTWLSTTFEVSIPSPHPPRYKMPKIWFSHFSTIPACADVQTETNINWRWRHLVKTIVVVVYF